MSALFLKTADNEKEHAKMARGEMVRFMAENRIENPEDIKKFDRLGYSFRSDLSSDAEYVFERKTEITSC